MLPHFKRVSTTDIIYHDLNAYKEDEYGWYFWKYVSDELIKVYICKKGKAIRRESIINKILEK